MVSVTKTKIIVTKIVIYAWHTFIMSFLVPFKFPWSIKTSLTASLCASKYDNNIVTLLQHLDLKYFTEECLKKIYNMYNKNDWNLVFLNTIIKIIIFKNLH